MLVNWWAHANAWSNDWSLLTSIIKLHQPCISSTSPLLLHETHTFTLTNDLDQSSIAPIDLIWLPEHNYADAWLELEFAHTYDHDHACCWKEKNVHIIMLMLDVCWSSTILIIHASWWWCVYVFANMCDHKCSMMLNCVSSFTTVRKPPQQASQQPSPADIGALPRMPARTN